MDPKITTNTVMMPRELTAENGAKGLMSGEFKESVTIACGSCSHLSSYDAINEDCEFCHGHGEYEQKGSC